MAREYQSFLSPSSRRDMQFNKSLVSSMDLAAELQGHCGCVNRLAWNESGTKLISGSDDLKIGIWNYPMCSELPSVHQPKMIESSHTANIFGVKFIPATRDMKAASGAMDKTVRLHDLERGQCSRVFTSHSDRVKAIEVENSNPNMLWSSGEDGLVFQYDLRTEEPQVLVQGGEWLEFKSITVNQVVPFLVGVGGSDQYVRIFDRRMLGTLSRENPCTERRSSNGVKPCRPLFEMCPHLVSVNSISTTHVQFSSTGRQLVAAYHEDHVYTFDVENYSSKSNAKRMERPTATLSSRLEQAHIADFLSKSHTQASSKPCVPTPKCLEILSHIPVSYNVHTAIEDLKDDAKTASGSRSYSDRNLSILSFETLITKMWSIANRYQTTHMPANDRETSHGEQATLSPLASKLYYGKGKSLFLRSYKGDTYEALIHAEVSIYLDSLNLQAQLLRIQCLEALSWFEEALEHLTLLQGAQLTSEPRIEKYLDSLKTQIAYKVKVYGGSLCDLEDDPTLSGNEDEEPRSSDRAAEEACRDPGNAMGSSSRMGISEGLYDMIKSTRIAFLENILSSASGADGNSNGRSRKRPNGLEIGQFESALQASKRLVSKLIGYSNMETDIKEATFLGDNDKFVAAGSDTGQVLIWCTESGKLVHAVKADEEICNCVQSHPFDPVIATSGIQSVVKLWTPTKKKASMPQDALERIVQDNQRRMQDISRQMAVRSDILNLHFLSSHGVQTEIGENIFVFPSNTLL